MSEPDVGFRPYDADRDLPAVTRIWREVGWIDDSDEQAAGLRTFLDVGHVGVATIDDRAECAVHWTPGALRYQDDDLRLAAVTAVTTSHIGRRLGFASRLTAAALAEAAAAGFEVAALGMFDQGFYDRLGFGSLSYWDVLRFDPSLLHLPDTPYRTPVRFSVTDDWADLHGAMVRRQRGHGGAYLDPPEIIQAEFSWTDDLAFALGYRADDGRVTHFVGGSAVDEHGPYRVNWIAYETTAQLFELLRLLHELADQVVSVALNEPAEIQLQDLLRQPFRSRRAAKDGKHEMAHRADSWSQIRMLDVAACVSKRRWVGPPVAFDLSLTDPLADRDDVTWNGVAGDYHVVVGDPSAAEPGHRGGDTPVLAAGVKAFTRLWFGVRPATSLALTDDIDGPPALLAALDDALRLPPPQFGWDF